jgi:hypothetical protein
LKTGNAIADANTWATLRAQDLAGGTYWQYIPNQDVFLCPVDMLAVGSGDWEQRPQKLSNYIMNGASAFYPPSNAGKAKIYGYRTCKASQIWSPLCIINWEPDQKRWFSYNDGSSYPDSNEGVGRLHVKGANVLSVGGNATMMTFSEFIGEMNHNDKEDNSKGKGLLYWNPLRADGHGYDE